MAHIPIKAFHLFVSSTFADFAEEREMLHSQVFPALDAYCAARGYQFYPIDLRWGVNEEAQLDQRAVQICLGEVAAAKGYPPPNFLIMLGDRYGWVPLPYAIAQDEFDAIIGVLERRAEVDAACALVYLYQRDDNHLVPRGLTDPSSDFDVLIGARTLRSREEMAELRSPETWARLESGLRRALQGAAGELLDAGRIEGSEYEKYFRSLTEQEIALGVAGFWTDAGTMVGEQPHGPDAIALIRESAGPEAIGTVDRPRLDAMKVRLRRVLPADGIITMRAAVDESGRLDRIYLATFIAEIQKKCEAAIDSYIACVEAQGQAPDAALQSDRDEHRAFLEQRIKIFVGRESNLAAIARYIESDASHPLVIHGRSGLGKSALLARAIRDAEQSVDAPVIYRFIGASAGSSDQRSLLISLVEDLAARGIADRPAKFEDDANKFIEQIRMLLTSITAPVVIVLDALDQLRNPYRPAWLPVTLRPTLRLVLSVLDDPDYKADSEIHRGLRPRLPNDAFLEIAPLAPEDGHNILLALEQQAGRRLRDQQRDYILAKFEQVGASPLYLRTAFEIARSWRSADRAGASPFTLADDTTALVAQFIDELTVEHHHEPKLVTRTLGYLTAAKDGLSAKEVTEILSHDGDVMQATSSERHGVWTNTLPSSVWARLQRQLSPFLIEKRVDDQPLLQFFHRQVHQVAHDRHYELPEERSAKTGLHAALADYFDPRSRRRLGRASYERRSLSELPFQLFHAGNKSRLDAILTEPDWMQQKLNAFGPQPLINDYEQFADSQKLGLIGGTLRLIAGICARDPSQLMPQLLCRLSVRADPALSTFLKEIRRCLPQPALITEPPTLTPPGPELVRLQGDTSGVMALAVLPDSRLVSTSHANVIRVWDLHSGVETAQFEGHEGAVVALAVLPNGRLVSGSYDKTIRVWDTLTGSAIVRLDGHVKYLSALAVLPHERLAWSERPQYNMLVPGPKEPTIRLWDVANNGRIVRLEGHVDWVGSLAMLPDGRLASGSDDKSIRLWDIKTGVEAARLEGHTGGVSALAVLPDGRLASGSADNMIFHSTDYWIRLWDINTGAEVARLEGHAGGVTALAVLPDGRLVSAADDNTIRLWDINAAAEVARLEGHAGRVTALAVLPDGLLASGSSDTTIKLWNINTGSAATGGKGHARGISALALLPDGRLASGSWDNTIRLWNPQNAVEIMRLKGHAAGITALAVMPDGRLISAGDDNTIRLWDIDTAAEVARLDGHRSRVSALAILSDGRLASGSWDHTIQLWDPKTGAKVAKLKGHSNTVEALAVLPDGRLVSAADDNTIRLWDINTAAEVARLEGDTGTVTALVVLPDNRLASGDDRALKLWDTESGNEIARLEGHTGGVKALAVLSDGRLVSGSSDNSIRLWNTGPHAATRSQYGIELAWLELDSAVQCIIATPDDCLAAGDGTGRLHWLKVVE